jgi:predicted small secreted protein
MKKVAIVTVAVLALGLAACNKNTDNNAANETAVENNAEYDVNAATTDVTNNADAALNAADNAIDNAGNAVSNAGNAVENAATNH